MKQLSLSLEPTNRFSLDYFVIHSGVVEAFGVLQEFVASRNEVQRSFMSLYLHGASGVGKKHLAYGFKETLLSLGMREDEICIWDTRNLENGGGILEKGELGSFVAKFEKIKSCSGLMIIIADCLPEEISSDPHFLSRIYHGVLCSMDYPVEDEIMPVVCSLAERRNLKLSSASIEYLVKHLPRDLLSFDGILARINELPIEGSPSKRAGSVSIRNMVKEIL